MAKSQAASIMFQQKLVATMNTVEKLMNENKMLDKKKKDNLVKISELISQAKNMKLEDFEAVGGDGRDGSRGENREDIEGIQEERRIIDSQGGVGEVLEDGMQVESSQEVVIIPDGQSKVDEENNVGLAELKGEEKTLLENIRESTKNLSDHKKELLSLEKENGYDEEWQAKLVDVKKFTVRHKKYKEATLKRIDAIRKEVKRLKLLKKKVVKAKIVINGGSTCSGDESSISFAAKRKLNESVLDCGEIVKKIPPKEREAMVPIVLKVEESPCEYPYECSFSGCGRFFTSAASLASHLGRHYPPTQAKYDCPFPSCQFSSNQEHLTKHMRSKHTKEQIFTCEHCSCKFHTMEAKVGHEKKHEQQDVWGQCDKEDCLRFYKLDKGHKSCVKH